MKEHVRYGSCPNYNNEVAQISRRVDHQVQQLGGRTSVSHSSITYVNRGDDQVSLRRRIVELNRENGSLRHEDKYFATLANDVLVSLKSSIQSCLSKIPDALLYGNTATLHGSEMGSSISQAFRRQRPHTDPLSSPNQREAQIGGFADAQDPQIRQLASALRSVVTEANLLIEQLNTDWRQYIEDVIKVETDPEILGSGIDLAYSLDAKYHAGNIDNRSESRLRDSDLSSRYEPDSMEPDYRISDHIPRSATQAGGRDFNSLNSPSMNRGSLNTGKSKEDQGQSWPYVEPLRIAHQQSQPSPGCDTASTKAKLRQRLAMLHYERMYYRRLANEAVVRFVRTIKHHVHEVRNLLHEYSAEENRLRGLLQQQINLRTTQHPNGDG
ncbi:hypothetical protein FOXG_16105 [Fusarium oxysporum f. sp. lycopersici 4287]|uniref:Uncharacterized protein n=1 Tax=Fusarium oxysporum f. sp. lycopersici (strain 4287 / CBS 123668 / FGSC 9935 / NRRL 34936) TaxID=426428 RepID=A0A0J9V0S4_FUSO4|nr:hypothetical protein FOXG_06906 [Fusarium oxysporum f. sp. lycopersici 4287]XP_018256665.1 hypothetical protein FOXG_16105 [Fusarium oxysporum f. sp. lycopersici 4287]KNB04920.1 hypothetical protein FOXG_06906 [Fusarium oxysporum f. sp. lycopersici 4287]KNB18620.1 hypothetical protein FOXG_16105 [Fusarium oxysporum f. sp. lycopersici 4287]